MSNDIPGVVVVAELLVEMDVSMVAVDFVEVELVVDVEVWVVSFDSVEEVVEE